MPLLAALLALLIASILALLELVTTKYPRTFFVLFSCSSLYMYSFLYGAIAFVIILIFPPTRFSLPDRFLEAIIVGLSIKALVNINFFSVPALTSQGTSSNSQETFPVGPQSVIRLIEPRLLEAIETHEFYKLRAFVSSRAARYSDPDCVQRTIIENLPRNIMDNKQEYRAFTHDLELRLESEPKVARAMEYYIYRMGKACFNQAFPS